MVRELADEPDGIGQQHDRSVTAHHLASRRVERCEQPVLDQDPRTCERVEERALAGVRVSDQGGSKLSAPPSSLDLSLARDGLELPPERGDSLAHPPAVDLQLRFTRTPRADAAG